MTDTLNVQNRRQAALYLCEMKGQISDGRWENSKPHNHWHKPCDAVVQVVGENSTNVGISWHRIRGYNFYETELQELLGDRMKRYVQFAVLFDHIPVMDLPKYRNFVDSPAMWSHESAADIKMMSECDTYKEFVDLLDAVVPYTDAQLHEDLVKLTQCFRKDQ